MPHPSFTAMTLLALAMAACLAAYFVFGDYTRKARITGSLAPAEGLVKVVAQQPGRVEALEVAEGGLRLAAQFLALGGVEFGLDAGPDARGVAVVHGSLREGFGYGMGFFSSRPARA